MRTKGKVNEILQPDSSTPLGTRKLAQEDSGGKLKDMFGRSDTFPKITCNKSYCHTIVGEKGNVGKCKTLVGNNT